MFRTTTKLELENRLRKKVITTFFVFCVCTFPFPSVYAVDIESLNGRYNIVLFGSDHATEFTSGIGYVNFDGAGNYAGEITDVSQGQSLVSAFDPGPISGTYSVDPTGKLIISDYSSGYISAEGSLIVWAPIPGDIAYEETGINVGIKEGSGMGVDSLSGTYNMVLFNGNHASEFSSGIGYLDFDGAGSFTFDINEVSHGQSPGEALGVETGSGTYSVDPNGKFVLFPGVDAFTGCVSSDSSLIVWATVPGSIPDEETGIGVSVKQGAGFGIESLSGTYNIVAFNSDEATEFSSGIGYVQFDGFGTYTGEVTEVSDGQSTGSALDIGSVSGTYSVDPNGKLSLGYFDQYDTGFVSTDGSLFVLTHVPGDVYGETGIYVGIKKPTPEPEFLAHWIRPEPPYGYTELPYTFTLELTNISMQSDVHVQVWLDETPFYPGRFWDLADNESWTLTLWYPGGYNELDDYFPGAVRLVSIPAGATVYADFTGSHKWQWLRPWDFFHVLTSLAVLVTDTPTWGSMTHVTLALTMEPYFDAVKSIQYEYTGHVMAEAVDIEDTYNFWVYVNPVKSALFGASIGLAATNFLPSAFGVSLLLSGVGAPIALPFFIWEAAQFGAAEALYWAASDPPDPNYMEIANVSPLTLAEVEELPSETGRSAARLALAFLAEAQAFRLSIERYQGASEASDTVWMSIHSQVASYHAKKFGELYEEAVSAYEVLVPAFDVPDPATMQAIRDYFANNGLPEIECKILLSSGFTEADVNNISTGLSTISDSQLETLSELYPVSHITATWLTDLRASAPNVPSSSLIAMVDMHPNTLNLKSTGKWITCYIELPEGYDVDNIDVSTITLNEQVIAESHPTEVGDYDDDGIPDLMVKFDRQELIDLLEAGEQILALTGQLTDGTLLVGIDVLRVIDKGKGKK